jgi:toxin ParE1/3/4
MKQRLSAAVESALELVRRFPEAFPAGSGDLRRIPLKMFPYVIGYLVTAARIRFVGIVHCARDPATWTQRLDQAE